MKIHTTQIFVRGIFVAFLAVQARSWAAAPVEAGVSTTLSEEEAKAKATGLQTRSLDALRQLEATAGEEYTIGDGDELEIQVLGRPELSGHHLVGPDGRITLPIAGSFEIKGQTRQEAAQGISKSFQRYYTTTETTVRVSKYGSNRILVLGRVARPGVLYFDNAPSLLEALTKSGSVGDASKGGGEQFSLPRRCAIFRGKDLVAWIDLKSMMDRGESAVDLRLKRDDVLYVPDEQDALITVLGEVQHPGMVKLESETTLLEVIAQAGGLTPSSGMAKIEIVRESDRTTREVPFLDLIRKPGEASEIALQKGDVIYVQKGAIAKFEYTLEKLAPLGSMMLFGSMVAH